MLIYDNTLWLLLGALFLDAVIGDPDCLWRRLPHPVVWIGNFIAFLDKRLNKPSQTDPALKASGVLALVILVLGGAVVGIALQKLAYALPYGGVLTVVITALLIAQRSLYLHVAAVRDGLQLSGLDGGRKAVAMIVGRDPEKLDEAGVSRAAIESCAENFSDGVVAPVFWFALLGLPGLLVYKAVNTADSMIGHKTKKYADFGWASARFDDLINLPASRLSGLLFALAAPLVGGSTFKSLKCIAHDAKQHRSPNAGWPEAAMAAALSVSLAGPRNYPGYSVEDPYMNASGRRDAHSEDISRSLTLLSGACAIKAIVVLLVATALFFI
ncbi:MAG: adenosylcobinamide-phosphate synthase CbiB [Roseibium sp.]